MTATEDQRPEGAVSSQGAADRLVRASWALAGAVLLGMAVRQEHPSEVEHVVAGVVLALALAITVVKVDVARWRRVAPWLVPALLAVAAVATWNPLGFYAVYLIAGHPLAIGAGAAAITAKALCAPGGHLVVRQLVAVATGLVTAALLIAGAFATVVVLAVGRAQFSSSTEAGSTRIDSHLSGDCNDGSTAVVRTGTGLLLREGPSSPPCTSLVWGLVNDHVIVVTCYEYAERAYAVDRYLDLDPGSLRTRAETIEGGCRP